MYGQQPSIVPFNRLNWSYLTRVLPALEMACTKHVVCQRVSKSSIQARWFLQHRHKYLVQHSIVTRWPRWSAKRNEVLWTQLMSYQYLCNFKRHDFTHFNGNQSSFFELESLITMWWLQVNGENRSNESISVSVRVITISSHKNNVKY